MHTHDLETVVERGRMHIETNKHKECVYFLLDNEQKNISQPAKMLFLVIFDEMNCI